MNEQEQTQFDEMAAALDESKRMAAGSDRAVQRLQAELAEAMKQPEPTTAPETTAPDPDRAKLDATLELIARRESIYKMALDRKMDPAQAIGLLMGDADSDRLDLIDDIRQSERSAVLKENGRNPRQGLKLNYAPMDLGEINKLPDDQIKRLDPNIVNDAFERQISDEKKAKNPGLGARLRTSLFGSK